MRLPRRYQELWEATEGFSHRLDPPGGLSGAWSGRLPDQAVAPDGQGGRRVVVRALQWAALPAAVDAQLAQAQKLARLAHAHVLPLLGLCEDPRHFVYEAMSVRALWGITGAPKQSVASVIGQAGLSP